MYAHAKKEVPNEACGIVAGLDGRPVKFFPATNVDRSPTRFTVDPKDVLRIQREIDAHGWELMCIFHSHTHTQAFPSSTDVNFAAGWPDQYYLIASLTEPDPLRSIRAFRIVNSKIEEVELAYRDDA